MIKGKGGEPQFSSFPFNVILFRYNVTIIRKMSFNDLRNKDYLKMILDYLVY